MRLPSLSQGKWTVGLWHNFWYFYPCFTRVVFFLTLFDNDTKKRECTTDDLMDGYNVAHLQNKTIQDIGRITLDRVGPFR